jgi:hypothetical protein
MGLRPRREQIEALDRNEDEEEQRQRNERRSRFLPGNYRGA